MRAGKAMRPVRGDRVQLPRRAGGSSLERKADSEKPEPNGEARVVDDREKFPSLDPPSSYCTSVSLCISLYLSVSLCISLYLSLPLSFARSLARSLNHSLTDSLIHSLTHARTHSLTHSQTPSLPSILPSRPPAPSLLPFVPPSLLPFFPPSLLPTISSSRSIARPPAGVPALPLEWNGQRLRINLKSQLLQ